MNDPSGFVSKRHVKYGLGSVTALISVIIVWSFIGSTRTARWANGDALVAWTSPPVMPVALSTPA